MSGLIARETDGRIRSSGEISLTYAAQVRNGRNKLIRERQSEAYTRSDFAWMGDLLDRSMNTSFLSTDVPSTFRTLGLRRNTADLARGDGSADAALYEIYQARLVDRVEEKGVYESKGTTSGLYNLQTFKYGQIWDLSWEAVLRDKRDFGAPLMEVVRNWGLSAAYTMEYNFTDQFAGHYGVGEICSAANGNYSTAGGALSATTLAAGILAIRGLADPAGNVVPYMGPLTLVVPPALEFTAKQLVNSQIVVGDSTVANQGNLNPLANTVNILVNHFLPILDNTNGDTAWYLFADPQQRAALRYGFLDGYEAPEVFIKSADADRFMGAITNPMDGSFHSDDVQFKLRFTFGANQLDYRGIYCHDGTS